MNFLTFSLPFVSTSIKEDICLPCLYELGLNESFFYDFKEYNFHSPLRLLHPIIYNKGQSFLTDGDINGKKFIKNIEGACLHCLNS